MRPPGQEVFRETESTSSSRGGWRRERLWFLIIRYSHPVQPAFFCLEHPDTGFQLPFPLAKLQLRPRRRCALLSGGTLCDPFHPRLAAGILTDPVDLPTARQMFPDPVLAVTKPPSGPGGKVVSVTQSKLLWTVKVRGGVIPFGIQPISVKPFVCRRQVE